MTKDEETIFKIVIGAVLVPLFVGGTFVLITALGLWRAYWFVDVWQWFVADTFGLPKLTVLQAWGLFLAIGYLTSKTDRLKNQYKDPFWTTLVEHSVGPLLIWGVAWVIKFQFMGG